jgi:hypothetical protein
MRLFTLIFLLFLAPKSTPTVTTTPVNEGIVCYFPRVYEEVRSHEGNYVHHPNDKGGRTYGGVSEKYNPDWYGWRYIKHHKYNERIEDAEMWVKDHYLTIWVREGFMEIKDYNLALDLFDFRINSSPKTYSRKVNKILNDMDELSVLCVEPKEFVLRLKIERILLYSSLALNDSTQRVFYRGWVNRLGV